jgi:hypothetical protein
MPDSGVSAELESTPLSSLTALQQAYTRRAVEVLMPDGRVAAAWMKGSLATGAAGFYSDVDMGVVVYDAHLDDFFQQREQFLQSIGPLVGMGEASVGSRVTVALFADPIEFDLTLDPLSAETVYGPEVGWVLFDKTDGRLAAAQEKARQVRVVDHDRALEIVTAFWLRAPRLRRWVAQADLHRAGKELQAARNALVELMLIANEPDRPHTIQKDTFILLSAHQWEELKAAYILTDFTPQALARCMMRLAYAVSIWGRAACARQGSEYPVELERISATAVSKFCETVFGPIGERDNGRSGR